MQRFLFVVLLGGSITLADPPRASATPSCVGWMSNDILTTRTFWETATVETINRCLAVSSLTAHGAGGKTDRRVDFWTPLHWAAAYSSTPEILIVLLDAGADLNAGAANGFRPLDVAARYSSTPEIIATLVEAGANVNAGADAGGWTPLDVAAMYNWTPAIITTLVALGADVNARTTEEDAAPLDFALMNDEPVAIITALLDAGANVNASGTDGMTPLHLAAMYKTPEIVTALLDAGADARAIDEKGKQPFDYATDNTALAGSDVYRRLKDAASGN